ncbi:MAG: hypothetical protein HY365_03910 [Candidatus Aenigmarchaeota archaeon]|nr:hypothetical protein [Candidatus Aenigmarchaeota archaeon]
MMNIISQHIGNKTQGNPVKKKKSFLDMMVDALTVAAMAALPTYMLGSFNFEPVIYTLLLSFFVQFAVESGLKRQ